MDTGGASETCFFRTSQIHKLQPTDGYVGVWLYFLSFYSQGENAMTPAGEFIQIMRC